MRVKTSVVASDFRKEHDDQKNELPTELHMQDVHESRKWRQR